MRWYLKPGNVRTLVGAAERVRAGGGPRSVRVTDVEPPTGWILPASTVRLELKARDGSKASIEPEVPVPLPLAFGLRLARRVLSP